MRLGELDLEEQKKNMDLPSAYSVQERLWESRGYLLRLSAVVRQWGGGRACLFLTSGERHLFAVKDGKDCRKKKRKVRSNTKWYFFQIFTEAAGSCFQYNHVLWLVCSKTLSL